MGMTENVAPVTKQTTSRPIQSHGFESWGTLCWKKIFPLSALDTGAFPVMNRKVVDTDRLMRSNPDQLPRVKQPTCRVNSCQLTPTRGRSESHKRGAQK